MPRLIIIIIFSYQTYMFWMRKRNVSENVYVYADLDSGSSDLMFGLSSKGYGY